MRWIRSGVLSLAALAGIALLCLPACSSLSMLSSGQRYLLGGTRENVLIFSPERDGVYFVGLQRFIAWFDFPFSLVMDVVLSPITLPLQVVNGDHPQFDALPPPPDEKKDP